MNSDYSNFTPVNSTTSYPPSSTLGKRPRESEMEEAHPNKKQKNDREEGVSKTEQKIEYVSNECFIHLFQSGEHALNPDIFSVVLNFLPFKDVIRFSEISKRARVYTEFTYLTFLKEEGLDLEWSDCDHEPYPHRARYLLGKTLQRYVNYVSELSEYHKDLSQGVQFVYEQFEFFMKRFPSLGAFISEDLSTIKKLEFIGEKTFEWKRPQHLKTGDHLLDALFQLTALFRTAMGNKTIKDVLLVVPYGYSLSLWPQYSQAIFDPGSTQSVLKNLSEKVIAVRATCASDLAIKTLRSKFDHNLYSLKNQCQQLAECSAKQGDYRSYEELLPRPFRKQAANESHSVPWPWMLVERARENKSKNANSLIDQAIEAFGLYVPAQVWLDAAVIKRKLKGSKEAEPYLDKAIAAFKENIPSYAWRVGGWIKWGQGKLEVAEEYFEREIIRHEKVTKFGYVDRDYQKIVDLLSLYDDKPYYAAELMAQWKYAGLVKYHLGKWEAAEKCFDRYMKYLQESDNEEDMTWDEWLIAANTKEKLRKSDEVKKYIDDYLFTAIQAFINKEEDYAQDIPVSVWTYVIKTKINLKEWKIATSYHHQLNEITANCQSLPVGFYMNAAKLCGHRGEWKQAKEFLDLVTRSFKNNIPPEVLKLAAMINFFL